jgi:hypothetical protein
MGARQRGRRKRRGWSNTGQRSFELEVDEGQPAAKGLEGHFLDDDPRAQWIGDTRLETYLRKIELVSCPANIV